jgi:hypothetical protein
MNEIEPIGMFELIVFKVLMPPGDITGRQPYYVQIIVPTELRNNTEAWVQAAACLCSYAARHSGQGYEKTLDIIAEQAMGYRDNPPQDLPVQPES